MNELLTRLRSEAQTVTRELLDHAALHPGDILVVGCSSSEVAGKKIGTFSSEEVAQAVFSGIYDVTKSAGVFLAAQCCEHLNRAIVIEKELARREHLPVVNAVPQPKAGGSFATAAYRTFAAPAAVEHICADAGIDIGGTLIGMHLREVAVPVRLSLDSIGEAHIICARTRPKFVGGARAVYDDSLL